MKPNPYVPRFALLTPADPADGVSFVGITIDLPTGMCPGTANPQAGSTLWLCPQTSDYPEVYALAQSAHEAAEELMGGFVGDGARPPVVSMEGAIAHIAHAVAALFETPVAYAADLVVEVLDGRRVRMRIDGQVRPLPV
jgi:hypothetical protein